ncbi:hypothetical protein [uncultured Campylobacter sp.]|nr:hypothetical protein [uncultured Campylobacter sp.]
MARENFRILRHGEILKFHSLQCRLNSKNLRLNEIFKILYICEARAKF